METYTVQNVENKITSTKKPYKRVTLVDGYGERTERVSIWSDFPGYHGIEDGSEIMGQITKSPDGKFVNLKPTASGGYSPKPAYSGGGQSRGSSYGVKAAQERKAESIEHAQDRKELSMRLAAAQRDAVLMVTTFFAKEPLPTDTELRDAINNWREWFLKEGKDAKDDQDVPF